MSHPQRTFLCQRCQIPVHLPELVSNFTFPGDHEHIVALLEGRLNTTSCLVCGARTALFTFVMVLNPERGEAIFHLPQGEDEEPFKQLLAQAREHFGVRLCHSYGEMLAAMLPWLNDHYLPRSKALFSLDYQKLPRHEQIELFTPLFLRIFKGQAEGRIFADILLAGGDREAAAARLEEFYAALVYEHLHRIMLEACRTRAVLDLPRLVEARVPKECLTEKVLARLAAECSPPTPPLPDPEKFMYAFMHEYLNAVAHALADGRNPRGRVWASYLQAVWLLSRRDEVKLDPQFLLPPELARLTVSFEDMWDVSRVRPEVEGARAEERLTAAGEMMEHYGFAPRYAAALKTQPFTVTGLDGAEPDVLDRFLETLKGQVLQRYKFGASAQESNQLGELVGGSAGWLIRDASKEAALKFVGLMLEEAVKAQDLTASLSIAAHAVEPFNKFEHFAEARKLVFSVLDLARDESVEQPLELRIYYWNELGNVLRHMHEYEKALGAYERVGRLIEEMPAGEDAEDRRSTLRRNQAIVYRDMGRFSTAIALLRPEAERRPEADDLQHTLALLYGKVNRGDEALEHIDRALASESARLDRRLAASYLVTRSTILKEMGAHEEGVRSLMQAASGLPRLLSPVGYRIACAAVELYPDSEDGRQFVEECKGLLAGALADTSTREEFSLRITVLAQFCKRLLRDGAARRADELLAAELQWLAERGVSLTWDFEHLIGWTKYELGEYEECWAHLKAALGLIDRKVPTAGDVSFAPFWMRDKEEFQKTLAATCLKLVGDGRLPADELVAVYEFMNGREISARLARRGDSGGGADALSRVRDFAGPEGGGVLALFFVESGEKVRLAAARLGAGVRLVEGLDLPTEEVLEIRRATQGALKAANPSDLSRLDRELAPWDELGARLGERIAPLLDGCARVCFLPGRAFTGLPLHLLRLPGGGPLIEHCGVSYAPNFAVLLAEAAEDVDAAQEGTPDARTLITVTKMGERLEFRDRAHAVGERLLALLARGGEARLLKEKEADRAAVTEALRNSSEVVFVCHGTTAGPEKGYGICIADSGDLPPTFLPVSEIPALDRFILTWQDIDELDRTPRVVTSVACSTGITQVAGGGVRFGLEQSLFGSGTRLIISPLWDVEQESALAWLELFYRLRAEDPGRSIGDAFRGASLELRAKYSHPYFWGAFILNGSVRQEVT